MVEEFTFDGPFKLTVDMKNAFERDGLFVVKNFMDKEELGQMWRTLNHTDGILKHAYTTKEADDKKITRVTYTHPGNDVFGMVNRCEKIVNTCEQLLGEEVYHYHTKLMLKNAREGGPHVWHQDYGYWYKHNLFPDMMSVWIPLDKATRHNSCLQVLKGSHRCGRIDHAIGTSTGQFMADLARVEELKAVCSHFCCEMDPGDALFFHCNILHTSSPNNSDMRRWAVICSYNKATNDSFIPHYHANYTPIAKVPDQEIKTCRNYTDFQEKLFLHSPQNSEN